MQIPNRKLLIFPQKKITKNYKLVYKERFFYGKKF